MLNHRYFDSLSYEWYRDKSNNILSVTLGENLRVPADGSHSSFIIEHYWGYTKRGGGRTDEYRVEHPKWELYSANDVNVNVDFGYVYGNEFAFLNRQQPYSVVFASGSEISVYKGERLL